MTYQPIANENATAVYELTREFTFYEPLCNEHAKRRYWPGVLVGKRILELTERHSRICHLCFKADNPEEF